MDCRDATPLTAALFRPVLSLSTESVPRLVTVRKTNGSHGGYVVEGLVDPRY